MWSLNSFRSVEKTEIEDSGELIPTLILQTVGNQCKPCSMSDCFCMEASLCVAWNAVSKTCSLIKLQ